MIFGRSDFIMLNTIQWCRIITYTRLATLCQIFLNLRWVCCLGSNNHASQVHLASVSVQFQFIRIRPSLASSCVFRALPLRSPPHYYYYCVRLSPRLVHSSSSSVRFLSLSLSRCGGVFVDFNVYFVRPAQAVRIQKATRCRFFSSSLSLSASDGFFVRQQ